MDFTRLYNEFNNYWANRDYQSAINNLTQVGSYLSSGNNDYYLVPIQYILKPENLSSLYANQNNIDLNYVVNNIAYSDLITWYRVYLKNQIQEIQDYQTMLLAQQSDNAFEKILDSITGVLSSPFTWIGLLLIATFLIFKD